MSIYDKYEAVIGLEVHAQLNTKSKAFSNDLNEYGALPNENVSVITLGHPGTLPRLNIKSPEFAIKMGLAIHANITKYNRFSRKNYFYADLPKGYQITQFDTPICTGGTISIKLKDGSSKNIGLTRIHMEEDAGKSIHDQDPFNTLVDLNRAGVPLIEIVSEPDMKSGEEAYQYLSEIRKLVRYLDICDGNMEEGSLRCDANVSVMLKGSKTFGQKVEVKNMNSIRNVQRAIEFEIKRQIDLLESNQKIDADTRTFNAVDGTTTSMRSKEEANDYRYFPEPDLLPFVVHEKYVEELREQLPPLPNALYEQFTSEFGLNDYDAHNLIETKDIALYFNALCQYTQNYKAAANWVMGEIKAYLNENALSIDRFPLKEIQIAEIIALIDSGAISHSSASQKLFPLFVVHPEKTAEMLAKENDLLQQSDDSVLEGFINEVIANNNAEVLRYKNGEHKLMGFFMGQLMKVSKGKADPKKSTGLMKKALES